MPRIQHPMLVKQRVLIEGGLVQLTGVPKDCDFEPDYFLVERNGKPPQTAA